MFRVLPGVNVRIEWEGDVADCLHAIASTLKVDGILDTFASAMFYMLLQLFLCRCYYYIYTRCENIYALCFVIDPAKLYMYIVNTALCGCSLVGECSSRGLAERFGFSTRDLLRGLRVCIIIKVTLCEILYVDSVCDTGACIVQKVFNCSI